MGRRKQLSILSMSYTVEQQLERAFVYLMRSPKWVAYSGVLMVGDTRVEDDESKCPTAYTDGLNCVYGRKFMSGLSEPEIRALIVHENLHKMFRHMVIWRHLYRESPVLANVACDFVINSIIVEAEDPGVVLPIEALYDPKYSGMDSQEVFNLLKQNAMTFNVAGGGGQGPLDEHGWEAAADMSAAEQADIAAQIDSAIRQGAMLAGLQGGTVDRSIGELMVVKTDWKQVLRDFFTTSCSGTDETSWRRPNRRWLQYDMYMPSSISEQMDSILIGVDTSGSIGGPVLTAFLSNVVRMLEQVSPESVDLLYWDAEVAGHERYTRETIDTLAGSTKPAGGGGTSPSCVTRYMKEHKLNPTCVVMLTDGWVGSDWGGEWGCPVIWAVIDNKSATPPGVCVHIESHDV